MNKYLSWRVFINVLLGTIDQKCFTFAKKIKFNDLVANKFRFVIFAAILFCLEKFILSMLRKIKSL